MRRIALRARLRRRADGDDEFIEIDPGALAGVFAAPGWLRDLGLTAWLLVGVAAALIGATWLLGLTQTIVVPVIVAGIVASVASPVVDILERRRVPRAAGAVMVFVVIIAIGLLITFLVLAGITSEAEGLRSSLQDAADKIQGWLQDLGVDANAAEHAKRDASASLTDGFHALLTGLAFGIDKLASLAVFLVFTVLSLFFMLKDAPTIGTFVERNMGVPPPVARTVMSRTTKSLRGYFGGVTIVAAWSAAIVTGGAALLGVSHVGTIAVVTFLGGFIPYIGAWGAGAFAVLIALGSSGPEAAGGMVAVSLAANGILQQLVQPIAYGAALGLHPLAVLVVTIAGGSMFGVIGLVLAAPLTSAAVRISADLSRARAESESEEAATSSEPPESGPAPAPA